MKISKIDTKMVDAVINKKNWTSKTTDVTYDAVLNSSIVWMKDEMVTFAGIKKTSDPIARINHSFNEIEFNFAFLPVIAISHRLNALFKAFGTAIEVKSWSKELKQEYGITELAYDDNIVCNIKDKTFILAKVNAWYALDYSTNKIRTI